MLNLARRALDRDELFDIGMVVVEHEHKSSPPRAPLLNHIPGRDRIQLRPRTGTRRCAVDRANVGAARAQGREVDAHAAAARHDLGHELEIVENALPAVLRGRYHVAVVKCYLMPRTSTRENTTTWNKLEVFKRIIKFLFPLGSRLRRLLHLGDSTRHTRPHLLWIMLQRIARGVLERVAVHKYFLANAL